MVRKIKNILKCEMIKQKFEWSSNYETKPPVGGGKSLS